MGIFHPQVTFLSVSLVKFLVAAITGSFQPASDLAIKNEFFVVAIAKSNKKQAVKELYYVPSFFA